jgi:hypothetical protein
VKLDRKQTIASSDVYVEKESMIINNWTNIDWILGNSMTTSFLHILRIVVKKNDCMNYDT